MDILKEIVVLKRMVKIQFVCTGNHKRKDCNSHNKKCTNCVRLNKTEVNHEVNGKCCQSLVDEIVKVRANTDHGY